MVKIKTYSIKHKIKINYVAYLFEACQSELNFGLLIVALDIHRHLSSEVFYEFMA